MIEIIIGLFLVFIIIREKQHSDEVKLLSKALIAKNVYELKDEIETDLPKEVSPKFPEAEEVSDQEFLSAIRKDLGRETPQDKFKEKIKKIWPTKSVLTPQK